MVPTLMQLIGALGVMYLLFAIWPPLSVGFAGAVLFLIGAALEARIKPDTRGSE